MTKEQQIDFFLENLPGKETSEKYHPEIVARAIEKALNEILYTVFRADPSNLDLYRKPYDSQEVVWTGDQPHVLLPAPVVQFPGKSNGVIIMGGSGLNFTPVSEGELDLISDLDVGMVDRTISFIVENDRITFYGMPTGVENIDLRYVPKFSYYDDDDEIYIPSGQEKIFNEMVLTSLGHAPVDKSNDNNPNTI